MRKPEIVEWWKGYRGARVSPTAAFTRLCALLSLLAAFAWVQPAGAEEDSPFTRLFDTVAPFSGPVAGDLLANQSHWRVVPEDNVSHAFSGDAVLLNDKLAVLVRGQGSAIEVWARAPGGARRRAVLGHAGALAAPLDTLASIKISQNTASSVAVAAGFQGSPAAALRLRLTTGEAILEVQSQAGAGFVEALSPARYVVVPDYFGDDLVYDAAESRGLFLPAENFCLNLLAGGEAVMMSVWQSAEQEAWLSAPGQGDQGGQAALRVRCLPDKNLWLAFMESPDLWHSRGALAEDGWKPPFPAKWRASCVRQNELADSWDLEQGPSAAQRAGAQAGLLIVYPLDRNAATPLTATCPTDVMRNTLGVGPCQYILACEGLAAQGDPTPNSVMGWVEKQFEQQRDRKAGDEIKERLEFMAKHVADAHSRIGRYALFAPQLSRMAEAGPASFQAIAQDLERAAAAGQSPAASPDRARQLGGEVAALVGQPNALPAVQRAGQELRALGALQDRALAKCRMDVRRARQEARTLARNSSDTAQALIIQHVAEQMLKNK